MKERPILFSGEMVLAILEGRKTQTRRVVKPDIADCIESGLRIEDQRVECDDGPMGGTPLLKFCPYGEPGTKLWVRETFAIENNDGYQDVYEHPTKPLGPVKYRTSTSDNDGPRAWFECPRYRASEPDTILGDDENGMKWKPSIFMPRWASRITLEILVVRVERLQSMSNADWCADFCPSFVEKERALMSFTGAIQQQKMAAQFWDSINGEKHPWKNNDFVWVIEFRRIE